MDRNTKEDFIADMKGRLAKAEATFLFDYKGLDVETMNKIRVELRKVGTEIKVVKNRLLKLASQGTGTESIKDEFVGPCALAITYEDIVGPAKILVGLSKVNDKIKIKAGQRSGKPMDSIGIKKLSELPSRDQLLAQLLSVMQGVPTSFVRVLNGVTVSFLNVLKAIEEKKGSE